jgi:hypothetical protein
MKLAKFGPVTIGRTVLTFLVFGFAIVTPFANPASASKAKVGLGSALSAWKDTYGGDSACFKNVCFGNHIPNSPSGQFQFVAVEFSNYGALRANSYQEDFAIHTSISFALFNVKLTLPHDTRYSKPRIGHDSDGDSCLIVAATSASLNKTTRISRFMIELFRDESSGLTTYNASDVTAAWVQPFVLPTSGGC